MTNQELINMLNFLPSLKNLKGLDFWMVISKAEDQLRSEIKHIQKALDSIDGLKEYEQERIALCIANSVKNKNHVPVMTSGNYDIADENKFSCALEDLQKKYKEAIDKRNEFLNRDNPIILEKLEKSSIPTDVDGIQFDFIKKLL